MERFKQKAAILRSVGIVTAVVVIVSAVTFAALQSQQDTLTGNTIETATADLQISTDGINYGASHAGFDFNNVVPGGQAVPVAGFPFYLKNTGGTQVSLRLAISGVPTNPNNADLSKVNVLVTPVGTGANTQTFTLQSLISSSPSGGATINGVNLSVGASQQFKLQISMNADAISGSVASLGNINFSFSGVATGN